MTSDERQIEHLLYRYAELIDAGDFAGLADLFTHGRIFGAVGRDAVLALYEQSTRRYPDTGTPKTQHVVTNAIVEVHGDLAESRSRFTVFQATDALPLQPVAAGRYRDTFRRIDGQWWFAKRSIHLDLTGDLSQHLLDPSQR